MRALLRVEASVLKSSYQKMRVGVLARLKKGEHVGFAVSHMDDLRFCWRTAQALNQPHPDIRFPCIALSSFAPRLARWGWRANKRLLDCTTQNLACFWQDCQHRLQIQSSPSPVANLAHSARLGMMREVHFCGVLHQQNDGLSLHSGARLGPMRLHQCPQSVTSSSESKRYKAIVPFQVCIWSGKDPDGFLAMALAT